MVKIVGTEEHSLAAAAGIRSGDILLDINKNEINDVLDYRFYLTERKVKIRVDRDGKILRFKIKKDEYEDIGLIFETPLMDKKHTCKNGCIFCFIDQNPKGMREPIYFKDDDSRLSFIHGNYITLTNMTDKDVERIVKMRFSPINVSVHTTNPDLRVKMMKNKNSGEVLRYLNVFKDAGIEICAQIVLCKGVNDGEELLRTMHDLATLYPSITSCSIVPAGLTAHREGLYPLTDFTPEEAGAVIDLVDSFATSCYNALGSRIFFSADELYLKSGRPLPTEDYYEGYPQIENGVGLLRSFIEDFEVGLSELEYTGNGRTVSVVTGHAAYPTIKASVDKICEKCQEMTINVYKIDNNYFGKSITVAGLMPGYDIYEQLKDKPIGEALYVPITALRHEEDDFLCGMTREELSKKLGVPVIRQECDGYTFASILTGMERT